MNGDILKDQIDLAWQWTEKQQRALDSGEITEEEWFQRHNEYFTVSYLSKDNPRAQSGHSGNEHRWRYAREIILNAVHKSGSFLDIGCANGHLIESLVKWIEPQYDIEFYGLDISESLINLAKKRLPHWKDRFYLGNALYWIPSYKFDFVRTGLEYVPIGREKGYLCHIMANYLNPGGRLIVGTYNEVISSDEVESKVASWGFNIGESYSRLKPGSEIVAYRMLWIEN